MKKEFIIIKMSDADHMGRVITQYLQKGWEFHGTLQVLPNKRVEGLHGAAAFDVTYIQALVLVIQPNEN